MNIQKERFPKKQVNGQIPFKVKKEGRYKCLELYETWVRDKIKKEGTEDFKKFLSAVFNNFNYQLTEKNLWKIEDLCIENEALLQKASFTKKIMNFFRKVLFSDAEEIPRFENLVDEKNSALCSEEDWRRWDIMAKQHFYAVYPNNKWLTRK